MANSKKIVQAAAGAAGGQEVNVSDVFSAYVWDGNDSTQTITNGLDLSGEGGMVWSKSRFSTQTPFIYDTERGVNQDLSPNETRVSETSSNTLTAFNSDGFSIGSSSKINYSSNSYIGWAWRRCPKFFDVVTWTGTGSTHSVSHSLNSQIGFMAVKATSYVDNWYAFHRQMGNPSSYTQPYLRLNASFGVTSLGDFGTSVNLSNTSSFQVSGNINLTGVTYVAYLWAHNNNDGEFGPDADQDIIKCGSAVTDGSGNATVSLGFEPQYVFYKSSTSGAAWTILDTLRGMPSGDGDFSYGLDARLEANNNSAEVEGNNYVDPNPDGFKFVDVGNGQTMIYIAIRKPPTKELESVNDFFNIDTKDGSGTFYAGWPADFALQKNNVDDVGTTAPWIASTRLMGDYYLSTNNTSNESANNMRWDNNEGMGSVGTDASDYCWMWRKFPGVFDTVLYRGNNNTTPKPHDLGVAPEMMWVKNLSNASYDWYVYHSALGNNQQMRLNLTADPAGGVWNNTSPTSTGFTVSATDSVNGSASNRYVAMLFATKAGFTKVGSYTGNGGSQTIDCGFTNGSKLVIIKNAQASRAEGWLFFDSDRGIITGNSPYLYLNENSYQFSSQNYLSPHSSGFIVPTGGGEVNTNGDTYIFYAIAAP